ncbi:hypothetical protein EXIGLDRAFT_759978 [Exidia glandulosa HHB12029]|uniref:Secreted protein n=1 Tax=Exidia glandulosa HHB12029 TaxID=1314781 RepID=A0A165PPL1_EXIGL|nr:hypothetical protein EXIGLDRAFT_759978 [Exidia glandulosa HHB12029]
MFKLTVAAFLAVAVAGVAGLVINTPTSLVACEPALLSFSGADGPVEIQVFKGGLTGDPSETPLEVLPVVPEGQNQTTWVVDTPAGQDVMFMAFDLTTGFSAFTADVSVTAGTET